MRNYDESRSRSGKKIFSNSESATATVIGAVMLLGIIFSVLTILWVECIPDWKNDAEYSHMDDVWEDMAELKSRIDVMSIVLASNSYFSPLDDMYSNSSPINPLYSNYAVPKFVTSVSFHMGGGDIPYIGSMKSSGTLAVNKGKCVMSIIVNPDTVPKVISLDCGTVTYTSQNNHYVDQVFSYENGAVILNQNEQSVMMLYPSIHFSNVSTSGHHEYNVSINTVSVCQDPHAPLEMISSNSEGSLRLTGINYKSLFDSERGDLGYDSKTGELVSVDKFILIITSNYPETWMQYFNNTMEDSKIGSEKYNVERLTGNNVRFTFTVTPETSTGKDKKPSNPDILRLYVSETEVKAEPGIGLS
ncbi:hypothetical protein [Methanosarcina sp.]|uniref:hypothetical protein n=1 Tax=Methanosarcina sp. TaxID=2213 RepID=UPI003C739E17